MKEIWKDVKDFEGYYQVSNRGRVKSLKRVVTHTTGVKHTLKERVMKLRLNSHKYPTVNLTVCSKSTTITVHILVATAFLDNPKNKPQVNHIDHVRHNNYTENLEWVTAKENVAAAINFGATPLGEARSCSLLTNKQVVGICEKLQDGFRSCDIAREYNVTDKLICEIKGRRNWRHIASNYTFEAKKFGLSHETIFWVARKLQEGLSVAQIYKLCTNKHVTEIKIYKIKTRKNYKSLTENYKW